METKISNIEKNDWPFLFIEGSSGVGKTQSAFALRSALLEKFKDIEFVYLVCKEPKFASIQSIYQAYDNINDAFAVCVKNDLEALKNERFDCTSLESRSLYIYGFIHHVLTKPTKNFRIQKKLWGEVREVIKCCKFPVVVLDEFPEIINENESTINRCRLMRNSVRALKIPLVIMGTNSTAANLLQYSDQSRGEEQYPWCFLFPRLPPIDTQRLDFAINPNEWILDIINASRPLLGSKAYEKLGECRTVVMTVDMIDDWLTRIANSLVDLKNVFKNGYGQHGQVAMFLNASYSYKSEKGDNRMHYTPLIHRHFACLPEKKPFYLTNRLHTMESTMWVPKSIFPDPKDDVLLYLCLMGTKGFKPFRQDDNQAISFRTAAENLLQKKDGRVLTFDFVNAVQSSNSGMFLEAVMASSLIAASRKNGLQGVLLREYMPLVLNHCSKAPAVDPFTLVLPQSEALANLLDSNFIPALAPPNQEWPECVQRIPGARFGTLSRTVNIDRIDIKTSFGLTGESKDYINPIPLTKMIEILDRVPRESRIHIVFTRILQNTYFKETKAVPTQGSRKSTRSAVIEKNSRATVGEIFNKVTKGRKPNKRKENHSWPNLCCCKVVNSGNEKIELVDINGLPGIGKYTVGKVLVLFLTVE